MPPQYWVRQGVLFFLLVCVFYINARKWAPTYLLRGDIGLYILFVIGAIVVTMIAVKGIEHWLNLPALMERAFHPNGRLDPKPKSGIRWFDTFVFLVTIMVVGISTSVTAVEKWQHDAEIRLALEQQRVSTELSFLKAQINPHFFFNTLNNIYALTLIDVDNAREALHRLSRMMRYVLYETQASTTLLSKELAFVQDYIQLMQLRLTDKVTVTFEQPSPLRDVPIAPMLLLPFVENAFKHGVSATHPSRIYVGIHQQNGTLEMEVQNTMFPEKNQSLEKSSGIGLANTRRRLDLLYPERYVLVVDENRQDNEYQVRLQVKVN